MPGLIDTTTGLEFGTGVNWLNGGLGHGPGLDDSNPLPLTVMITEAANIMITEGGDTMVSE